MMLNLKLHKNLEALNARHPALVPIISKSEPIKELGFAESKTCLPIMTCVQEGKTYLFESPEDPDSMDKATIAGVPDSAKVLIICGLGSGRLVRHALNSGRFEKVILIETDMGLLAHTMRHCDISDVLVNRKLCLVIGSEPNNIFLELTKMYDHGTEENRMVPIIPEFSIVWHPCMIARRPFYLGLEQSLKNLRNNSERNKKTIGNFMHEWREAILGNLPHLMKSSSVSKLFGATKGKPGVLVSAGPSLTRDLKALAKYQDKVYIFCTDAAFRSVRAYGIEPDFVVSLDSQDFTSTYIVGDDSQAFGAVDIPDRTSLVMIPVISPKIVEKFSKVYVASYGHPFQKWVEQTTGVKFGQLLVNGSVSTLAFDLMRNMGCDPLILVGQDLSYGDDCKTHVLGARNLLPAASRFDTCESFSRRSMNHSSFICEGVKTTHQMKAWQAWFEGQAKLCKVINCTSRGLSIPGAEKRDLEEILKTFRKKKDRIPYSRPKTRKMSVKTSNIDGILLWEKALMTSGYEALREEFGHRLKEKIAK